MVKTTVLGFSFLVFGEKEESIRKQKTKNEERKTKNE